MTSPTLALTEALISKASVTPLDENCQNLIQERLKAMGFECQSIVSGPDHFKVTNLWAKRSAGTHAPTLVFAGHTDVVPTGPLELWDSPPFTPSYRDGKLYGRGASDMKASLAAMIVACEEFLAQAQAVHLSIAFLLTSDEEGPAHDGTVVVCEHLKKTGESLNWCVVGEPTAVHQTGDMIKNGRRGTMSGKLTIKGIQGHIAYPHLAKNPIHMLASGLTELVNTDWDEGNAYFQKTSFQVSNFHAGTGASNVIPAQAVVDFNFRFNTEQSPESLQNRFIGILENNGLKNTIDFDVSWTVGGLPFLTPEGQLVQIAKQAIFEETGLKTELSTSGGTSDGRFIAKICPEVVEIGPPNASIHQINEYIHVHDVEPLKNIYKNLLMQFNLSSKIE